MALSDVVQVNITATSAFPTLPNFGEPLIAAYTSVFVPRTQEFTSLAGMVSAGFTTSSAAYLCAVKVFSQNPSVPALKVGRRLLPFTQTLLLTATVNTPGAIYNFSVGGKSVTYTVPNSSSLNATAAALTTAITALGISGLTATNPSSPSPNVQLAVTAGSLVDVQQDAQNMTFADNTTLAGGGSDLTTDLNAILAFDGNWYGLLLDSNSPVEITAAAAWAESNQPRMFVTNASDTAVKSAPGGDTTSILHTLNAAAYTRTVYLHSQAQLQSYSGAAWMGKQFTQTPGSDNWAFKTLSGVFVDSLTDGEVSNIKAKKGNVYTTLAGVNVTRWGFTPSGQFADTTRFIDWLQVNLQTAIFSLLANNPKIPFTDAGLDAIRSTMTGVFKQGIDNGGIADGTVVINIPTVASISATDKANRNVPNVTFRCTLAGAVNSVVINGSVSF